MGYLAYLITGRFYFMEEMQFAATVLYLKQSSSQRQASAGIIRSNAGANTTRGMGWAMRTLCGAAEQPARLGDAILGLHRRRRRCVL
jgi:hypothetical protein